MSKKLLSQYIFFLSTNENKNSTTNAYTYEKYDK